MEPVEIVFGTALPLNRSDIDTDQIIPKQFLKLITKSGFGKFLFYDWRFDQDGNPKNDFILNNENFSGKILIGGKNFGSGSSREHAVWAIKDFGIDAVISSSFADIFYRNSFRNGLLLITITKLDLEKLFQNVEKNKEYELTIDLINSKITSQDGLKISYTLDTSDRDRIINGQDDIAITLENKEKIINFENEIKRRKPWLYEE